MRYQFSYFDLWPYILIAFIFLYCHWLRSKNTSKIIFSTLFIFCALRYDVGWDYMSYVSLIEMDYEEIIDSRIELLSNYILLLGNYVNFYPIVFIIFSFLTLKITFFSIKKYSINPLISWLVFYSMPLFFFASLSTLRQSLATAIVFYSYSYVKEKKYLNFIAAIFVASLFHTSSIIGFFILPLVLLRINKFLNIILLLISFIVSTFLLELISTLSINNLFFLRFIKYVEMDSAKPQLLNYLYYFIGILNLIFYHKLSRNDDCNKDYITLINFGLIFLNIFSFEPVTSLRISAFYLMFLIYLLPNYLNLFDTKFSKILENIFIFGFISLSFFYLAIYINNYNNWVISKISFIPYKFWFNEH